MANCVTCKARCVNAGQHRVKTDCISHIPKDELKPKTNYDLLISKTPEELALFIHNAEAQAADIGNADTVESWLDWLKSSADKEN